MPARRESATGYRSDADDYGSDPAGFGGSDGSSATERAGGVDGRCERFETLLLPVGDSDLGRIDTLAATAAEVAGMMELSVRVLHVLSPSEFERIADRLDGSPGVEEAVRHVDPVHEALQRLEPELQNWGTAVALEGRVGESVSEEIVAAAEAADARRILVGGRRRTPVGKEVFGSTVQEVLLNAPCPTTFVRDT
jgi:nucleotide-binding universal stress UspA family protein